MTLFIKDANQYSALFDALMSLVYLLYLQCVSKIQI